MVYEDYLFNWFYNDVYFRLIRIGRVNLLQFCVDKKTYTRMQ